MKKIICCITAVTGVVMLQAQTYPQPEYANEVYYLKKDSAFSLVRLEKNSATMSQSTKIMGGSETSYSFDGDKSAVHLPGGVKMSFIFTIETKTTDNNSSADSAMKANGMDPGITSTMMGGITDPSNNITLYKMDASKSGRKIILMKAPGMNPFGSHKVTSSEKYTFSVKKIKDGYWELVIDKMLPKGEYAFALSGMMNGMSNMMGGNMIVFAFRVE